MIPAGLLRENIRVKRSVKTENPAGGWTTDWVTVHETLAKVEEKKPSLDVIAQQENMSTFIEIKIRFNPNVNIKIGDRITWRGFVFTSMKPTVDMLRTTITILAFSEIETTDRGNGGTV